MDLGPDRIARGVEEGHGRRVDRASYLVHEVESDKLAGKIEVDRFGRPLDDRLAATRELGAVAGGRSGSNACSPVTSDTKYGLTRDKLLAYLWPERDTDQGRHSLSQALYAIRQDLGDSLVKAGLDDLRINPEGVSCDVWEFDDALAAGQTRQAEAAYGGPFLDGFFVGDAPEFERWVAEERQQHAQQYASAIERLAEAASRDGDAAAAAAWWRRLAALDPLDSRVAMGLMHALAAGGNRAAAIQHARVHAALLAEELGVGPDQRLQAWPSS